jgi:hypothetical protein
VSERSAGWAGIFCVVAVAIAVFVRGYPLPSAADSGNAIAAFLTAHRLAWLVGGWLTFPEAVFFLWFFSGLLSRLRRLNVANDALRWFALSGAIGTVAAGLIATSLQIVLGVLPSGELGAVTIKALYVGWLASGVPVLFMPLAIAVGAVSLSLRRLPSVRLLEWSGYCAVALSVLGTLTTFFTSGPLALNGLVGYAAFFAFAVWTLLVSRYLIAR